MTALIRDMAGLVAAARSVQIERGLSDQLLEHLAGMASGSVPKYLAPRPSKNLGPISTFLLLGAMGKCLALVDDPEMVARMEKRWQRRIVKGGATLQMRRFGEASMLVAKPQETQENKARNGDFASMQMWGQMGGKKSGEKRRAKAMKRRAIQRVRAHAARKRWSKAK